MAEGMMRIGGGKPPCRRLWQCPLCETARWARYAPEGLCHRVLMEAVAPEKRQ